MNFVSSQTGYSGENSLNVEFGFGNATIIDSLKIEWPSGRICYLTNVATDQFVNIDELCNLSTTVSESVSERKNIFSIYPNPVTNDLNILFNNSVKGKILIKLYDETARLIKQYNFSENKYINIPNLNQQIKAGIYFISLQSEDKLYWQKIVMQ